jgi:dihydrofolate synthase/folylpolyglutamate synthase
MSRTLAEWLAYQERVNVRSIELGLDRVNAVWQRMGAAAPAPQVITVAGTNGKGSTVALLEAMLMAAGLRVGCFTSPHLLTYNERIRIDGIDVDDTELTAAFERIEAARGADGPEAIPLTYFEFGTLAALDLFARDLLDVAILEVGLGGRLDAVNIVDADVAIITTVDLDHMEWLGADRDSIVREKAGIARAGRPAIVGEADPPGGLLDALTASDAWIERAGIDFWFEREARGWQWRHRDGEVLDLPDPALSAPVQFVNASTAIAALHTLYADGSLAVDDFLTAVRVGLQTAKVPARLQSLGGDPVLMVDVGHNPQAARALAEWLDRRAGGPLHVVYGALADKDIAGVMTALGSRVDHWHLAGLDRVTPRGVAPPQLAATLCQALPGATFDEYPDVAEALAGARATTPAGGCILAFGSFFVASAAIAGQQD